MSSKSDINHFIEKSVKVHGSKYSYINSVYVNSTTPLEISCAMHGGFWMTPNSHYAGCGCSQCHKEQQRDKAKLGFINKSIAKFGDLIDHSKTIYNGPDTKAELHCKIHGKFEVLPNTHLSSKHGCTTCGALASPKIRAEKNKATFLEDSYRVHGDTYSYEKMDYKAGKDKIEITCKTHGSFWQIPDKHKIGQGCPDCAMYGYNTSRPGNFYILTNGEITKVGITHQQVKERMWQINKSHKSAKFKIVTTMFYQDGSLPRKLESACLTYLRSKYRQVQEVFDGSTECFLNVDLSDLLSFVIPIATQSELEQSSQPIMAQ